MKDLIFTAKAGLNSNNSNRPEPMSNQPATTGNAALSKAGPKPEVKLIDSLKNTSALKVSENKLADGTYMSLLALQKSVTLADAATASTVVQVVKSIGEPTVIKLICAILKLFNEGLNTSLQMSPQQLFEYGHLWVETFPHETVKDLILCLKRVKTGQYGPIYNRVDATVISDFFRQYLLEKADWKEQQQRELKSQHIKAGDDLMNALPVEGIKSVRNFIQRSALKKTPDVNYLNSPVSSDRKYTDYLAEHAEEIEFEVLEDVYKRAKDQKNETVLAIVKDEFARRDQQFNQELTD